MSPHLLPVTPEAEEPLNRKRLCFQQVPPQQVTPLLLQHLICVFASPALRTCTLWWWLFVSLCLVKLFGCLPCTWCIAVTWTCQDNSTEVSTMTIRFSSASNRSNTLDPAEVPICLHCIPGQRHQIWSPLGHARSASSCQVRIEPSQDRIVPAQDRIVQGQDRTLPGEDRIVQGQDRTLPGHDRIEPGQDRIVPAEDTIVPGQDRTLPGQDALVQGQDKTLPDQDTIAPGQDRSVPVQNTIVPGQHHRAGNAASPPVGQLTFLHFSLPILLDSSSASTMPGPSASTASVTQPTELRTSEHASTCSQQESNTP